MSINRVDPKVTADVIVEDFREQMVNIKIKDSNLSTGVSEWDLYTHDQVVNLLLKFGAIVNNNAEQSGWKSCPVQMDMIERFVNDI